MSYVLLLLNELSIFSTGAKQIFAELSKTCTICEIYFPWKLSRNLYIAGTRVQRAYSSGTAGVHYRQVWL